MRKAFKLLFFIILLLAVMISTFYFWASSDFDEELPRVSIESKDVAQIQMYKDSISIMTYNLGYLSGMTNNKAVDRSEDLFTGNFGAAMELLEENMIDIASFQEIDFNADRSYNHDQAGELAEALGYPYIAKAINWNKTYVPVIISSLPIKTPQRPETRQRWRSMTVASAHSRETLPMHQGSFPTEPIPRRAYTCADG